jgi:hypothetical protein
MENIRKTRAASWEIKQQDVVFQGQNGAGKSTIGDSIYWCWLGKNLAGAKEFGIKTLADGVAIPQIDHRVIMKVVVFEDGQPTTMEFERNFREVWAGALGGDPRMTGHTTEFKVNGMGCTMAQYDKFVASLGDMSKLPMLTRPDYFAKVLDWKERRAVLFSMISTLTDDEVAGSNADLLDLLAETRRVGVSLENFRKWLADHVSPLEKQISEIPTRIDEAQRQKRELVSTDGWRPKEDIQADIDRVRGSMSGDSDVELQRLKVRASEAALTLEQHAAKQRRALAELDQSEEYSKALHAWNSDRALEDQRISTLNRQINDADQDRLQAIDSIAQLKAQRDAQEGAEWTGSMSCSTCQQSLPADQIETARHTFNLQKAQRLADIQKRIESYESKERDAIQLLNSLRTQLSEAQDAKGKAPLRPVAPEKPVYNPEGDAEYGRLLVRKRSAEREVEEMQRDRNLVVSSMRDQLDLLTREMGKWDERQRAEHSNASVDSRVEALKDQQKTAAQEAAKFKRYIAILPKWIEAKAKLAEESINSKFTIVKWKLHQALVNGSLEECCIPTINGVPFEDRSDGEQINAGLDIIEALGTHFGCRWPIIIDRAESVHPIYRTTAQQIQLRMTPYQEQITIERI